MTSFRFFRKLTAVEVGDRRTHEVYIRMPNDFDFEHFFNNTHKEAGTVIEVVFTATVSSNIHPSIPPTQATLRFVFFANSNKEKRIPSLGSIFETYKVKETDAVCLEKKEENGVISFSLTFLPSDTIHFYKGKGESVLLVGNHDNNQTKEYFHQNKDLLQVIYYGAPGTGKSRIIKNLTKGEDVIRTTFHPDSDYSSFVGAYKPTTSEETATTVIGTKSVPVENTDGLERKESKIVYEFVAQAFLQAYIAAWMKYATAGIGKTQKQYLVIEEINRGNCAQIFGDLFQLLDRNDYGFSDYPIKADADMQRQLQKAFNGIVIDNPDYINSMYEGREIAKAVVNGDILLLPNNLHIWATMNTSDQSLFPIDSAFKRRWDWKYMPISNAKKDWVIEIGENCYDWWTFLKKINEKIDDTTHSEDKKLGYFFCKAKDGIISAETFTGKVIFYLWNDVFKDYEFSDAIFNDENGGKLTFDKFHTTEGYESKVVEEKIALFLKNLGIATKNESGVVPATEDEEGNLPDTKGKNFDKFTVNDGPEIAKKNLAYECIKKFIELHPDMPAEEVYNTWASLGDIVPHFVETAEQYDARTDSSKRSYPLDCAGTKIYVAWNGYGNPDGKADLLMDKVNNQNWGITIRRIIKPQND